MTHEQQGNEWLATVKARAMTRVKAEAAAEEASLSDVALEWIDIGVMAGASEMLTLLDELGLRRRPE